LRSAKVFQIECPCFRRFLLVASFIARHWGGHSSIDCDTEAGSGSYFGAERFQQSQTSSLTCRRDPFRNASVGSAQQCTLCSRRALWSRHCSPIAHFIADVGPHLSSGSTVKRLSESGPLPPFAGSEAFVRLRATIFRAIAHCIANLHSVFFQTGNQKECRVWQLSPIAGSVIAKKALPVA
jgi:hypothetical protein